MKLTYRPEIDGMRAVAVVKVILYHARLSMHGDTILAELYETGAFNFRNFYERRIRRILPILFTVMLSSVPFAWLYMLPAT